MTMVSGGGLDSQSLLGLDRTKDALLDNNGDYATLDTCGPVGFPLSGRKRAIPLRLRSSLSQPSRISDSSQANFFKLCSIPSPLGHLGGYHSWSLAQKVPLCPN